MFTDDKSIYEFCSEVQEYMGSANAPDHFTPLAAAQFVAESICSNTQFNKGRLALLEQEISVNTTASGYVPTHLSICILPRTILDVYDHEMKWEL